MVYCERAGHRFERDGQAGADAEAAATAWRRTTEFLTR
jgi:dienelactone hydrolase